MDQDLHQIKKFLTNLLGDKELVDPEVIKLLVDLVGRPLDASDVLFLRRKGVIDRPTPLAQVVEIPSILERFDGREYPPCTEEFLQVGYHVALSKYQRLAVRELFGMSPSEICVVLETAKDRDGKISDIKLQSTAHAGRYSKSVLRQFRVSWPQLRRIAQTKMAYDELQQKVKEEKESKSAKVSSKPKKPKKTAVSLLAGLRKKKSA
jgi:hypothetical protein